MARPSQGTIASTPSGIDCPAGSGGDCTAQDSQTVTCVDGECEPEPTTGWDSYTLTASDGPSGFAAGWSGDCSSSSTCNVTLDGDKTVAMSWLDVTNPTVSLSVGQKVGKMMNVSATASDNAGVFDVQFWVDGALKATDTAAPYSASIAMDGYADGTSHTVLARAVDTSGRISDVSKTVTLDKQVSITVGTVPAFTNAAFVPVSLSTDPDASVKCQVNSGTATACAGAFSPSLPTDGTYTYTLTATDDVGNVASVTRSFVVDRTAPDVSFTDGPSEGATVAAGDITVGFDYSDTNLAEVACNIDGAGFAPCAAAHAYTFSHVAPGTSHSLVVRVTDKAGNATTITRHFAVTPAPPASGGAGNGSSGQVNGGNGTTPNKPRLAAKLSSGFKLKGKNTLVRKLVLSGLPAGAKVKMRCKGHGCPFRSKSFKPSHGKVNLAKAFKGRKLAKGAKIEIDVMLPGASKQVFKLSTRSGKKPLVKSS
ncbi:MAG TPA: Ig-like domain-containing protein [Thermoleophilaceae bacterium]